MMLLTLLSILSFVPLAVPAPHNSYMPMHYRNIDQLIRLCDPASESCQVNRCCARNGINSCYHNFNQYSCCLATIRHQCDAVFMSQAPPTPVDTTTSTTTTTTTPTTTTSSSSAKSTICPVTKPTIRYDVRVMAATLTEAIRNFPDLTATAHKARTLLNEPVYQGTTEGEDGSDRAFGKGATMSAGLKRPGPPRPQPTLPPPPQLEACRDEIAKRFRMLIDGNKKFNDSRNASLQHVLGSLDRELLPTFNGVFNAGRSMSFSGCPNLDAADGDSRAVPAVGARMSGPMDPRTQWGVPSKEELNKLIRDMTNGNSDNVTDKPDDDEDDRVGGPFWQQRRKRQATTTAPKVDEPEIGTRTQLRCTYKRGDVFEDDGELVGLCNLCWSVRILPRDYFPRYVNELTCHSSDSSCLSQWGSCRPKYHTITVLKDYDPQSANTDFKKTSLRVAVSCECFIRSGSALHNFVRK